MTDTPPRRYVIGRWDPLTVGIDIGGTKVLAGVVDSSGRVLERQRRDTPGSSVRDVENTIVDLVLELGRTHDVAAVGVGAAGFVDVTRSVVKFSPHLAWRDEPLRDAVMSRLRSGTPPERRRGRRCPPPTRPGPGSSRHHAGARPARPDGVRT